MSVDLREKSATYRVEMELLSPLHVDSGRELLQDVDWIEHQGQVYVADQEVLLEEMLPEIGAELDASAVDHLVGMKLGDMVNELQRAGRLDWDGPCFRYSLPGQPVGRTPQQIHEQIKNAYGWPYLPGSSLKGTLRSLLARHVVEDEKRRIRINYERDWRGRLNPRVAAKKMERNLFITRTEDVNESNYDLWRAVQVADSGPVDDPDRMALARVDVYPPRPSGRPRPQMNVEVLRTGTPLTATLKLDHTLFLPKAEERLRFGHRRRWLEELVKRARDDSNRRLVEEVSYFYELRKQGYAHCPAENFLDHLADLWRDLGPGEFLVQVGWGPGWPSKTLGGVMRQRMGEDDFVEMANDFHLAWDRRKRRSKWVKNGLAPLTRRLATVNVDGEQLVPLGWMKVKLEEHRREQAVLGDQLPSASSSGWRIGVEEEPVEEPVPPTVVSRPEDLQEGMVLEGTVRNVVRFGAFVDIGVGHDGLVHVSELAEGYVRKVEDVVRVGQRIRVRVLSVERRGDKWRIGLTMKGVQQETV